MAAEAGHYPNRMYTDQLGNMHLNGSSLFDASENDVKNIVSGTAAGVKCVAGEVALDGSNPTPVSTGLTTITGVSLTIKKNTAPGVGTSVLTYDTSGGTLNIYGWKVTASGDATLIASTGTETIGYVVFGT